MQLAQPDHYSILGIPTPKNADDPSITPEVLKSAYRNALLLHHPDRRPNEKGTEGGAEKVTVDQIVQAYEVLADPIARARYHDLLVKQRSTLSLGVGKGVERSAVETFDLEELECRDTDQGAVWERLCRCGGLYLVSERQLGEVAGDGEIVMGCRGCSLFIRVVFDVVEG